MLSHKGQERASFLFVFVVFFSFFFFSALFNLENARMRRRFFPAAALVRAARIRPARGIRATMLSGPAKIIGAGPRAA